MLTARTANTVGTSRGPSGWAIAFRSASSVSHRAIHAAIGVSRWLREMSWKRSCQASARRRGDRRQVEVGHAQQDRTVSRVDGWAKRCDESRRSKSRDPTIDCRAAAKSVEPLEQRDIREGYADQRLQSFALGGGETRGRVLRVTPAKPSWRPGPAVGFVSRRRLLAVADWWRCSLSTRGGRNRSSAAKHISASRAIAVHEARPRMHSNISATLEAHGSV
jgi:hypothetical protein